MPEYFLPIYTTLVGTVIGLLIGWIRSLITKSKKSKDAEVEISEALKEGMAILLRDRLFVYYEKYEYADEIPASEWAEIESTHKVYNRLGGNHTGDRIFKAMEEKHISGALHAAQVNDK